MIARMWHGIVPPEKAAAYHQYLLDTGLKHYAQVPGNRGVMLLMKDDDLVTHFYTWSYWDSYASIREFAGEDVEKARYYPEDQQYLLEFEEQVTHYQILEFEFPE